MDTILIRFQTFSRMSEMDIGTSSVAREYNDQFTAKADLFLNY